MNYSSKLSKQNRRTFSQSLMSMWWTLPDLYLPLFLKRWVRKLRTTETIPEKRKLGPEFRPKTRTKFRNVFFGATGFETERKVGQVKADWELSWSIIESVILIRTRRIAEDSIKFFMRLSSYVGFGRWLPTLGFIVLINAMVTRYKHQDKRVIIRVFGNYRKWMGPVNKF